MCAATRSDFCESPTGLLLFDVSPHASPVLQTNLFFTFEHRSTTPYLTLQLPSPTLRRYSDQNPTALEQNCIDTIITSQPEPRRRSASIPFYDPTLEMSILDNFDSSSDDSDHSPSTPHCILQLSYCAQTQSPLQKKKIIDRLHNIGSNTLSPWATLSGPMIFIHLCSAATDAINLLTNPIMLNSINANDETKLLLQNHQKACDFVLNVLLCNQKQSFLRQLGNTSSQIPHLALLDCIHRNLRTNLRVVLLILENMASYLLPELCYTQPEAYTTSLSESQALFYFLKTKKLLDPVPSIDIWEKLAQLTPISTLHDCTPHPILIFFNQTKIYKMFKPTINQPGFLHPCFMPYLDTLCCLTDTLAWCDAICRALPEITHHISHTCQKIVHNLQEVVHVLPPAQNSFLIQIQNILQKSCSPQKFCLESFFKTSPH